MKSAYLISAYTDAPHLLRLVRALGPEAECFVHVDARADIRPFRALPFGGRVHFIERRHAVIWGDITQVRYQRDLLQASLSCGREFDRLFLLSGQDYPLWSPQELDVFYARQPRREDICGIDLASQRAEVVREYLVYRPQAWLPLLGHGTNLKLRILLRKLLHAAGLRKRLTFKVGGEEVRVCKGSDYWSVTPRLARWMLDELERRPEYMRYFSTMFVPSELIWQTLAFRSPYAANALLKTGDYTTLADLTPLHYIYYHPLIKVLTEADWETVRRSGKPFCRKVVTGRSDGFVALCEARKASGETLPSPLP